MDKKITWKLSQHFFPIYASAAADRQGEIEVFLGSGGMFAVQANLAQITPPGKQKNISFESRERIRCKEEFGMKKENG